ncbi:hypothetical protein B0H19DRAFT_1077566 [Mycena capillaripes]|nr:hypothetical protein B0H19DRAFT_1077566 [Mycena capillaripes]
MATQSDAYGARDDRYHEEINIGVSRTRIGVPEEEGITSDIARGSVKPKPRLIFLCVLPGTTAAVYRRSVWRGSLFGGSEVQLCHTGLEVGLIMTLHLVDGIGSARYLRALSGPGSGLIRKEVLVSGERTCGWRRTPNIGVWVEFKAFRGSRILRFRHRFWDENESAKKIHQRSGRNDIRIARARGPCFAGQVRDPFTASAAVQEISVERQWSFFLERSALSGLD